MATKIALQEEIKKLNHEHGFNFPVSDNYKELQKSAADARKAAAAKTAPAGGDNTPKSGGKNAKYVWLKSPAYVDKDGTKRVAGGFYHIDLTAYPRLSKIGAPQCQVFDEVPVRKLAEIAKWFGMNPERYKTDEALLAALISEPSLY